MYLCAHHKPRTFPEQRPGRGFMSKATNQVGDQKDRGPARTHGGDQGVRSKSLHWHDVLNTAKETAVLILSVIAIKNNTEEHA